MIAVEYIDHMGGDLAVVNSARVSFGKAKTELDESDARLIRYLARNNHSSPFEHATVSVRCSAPIFLARQLAKSTVGLSWNEWSRRYIDDEPEIYWPDAWRKRPDKSIKQGSGDAMSHENKLWNDEDYGDAVAACEYAYRRMLERGTAPEQARMVLPQSMITRWVWTGSLSAFARVYRLRIDSHAQVEAQQFAALLKDVIEPVAPHSWAALTGAA